MADRSKRRLIEQKEAKVTKGIGAGFGIRGRRAVAGCFGRAVKKDPSPVGDRSKRRLNRTEGREGNKGDWDPFGYSMLAGGRHLLWLGGIKKLHRMVEFDKLLVPSWLRIKAKLQFAAFGSQLCFAADLLRRRFESTQTANLFHNPFSVELVLQPFERSIDWLTFSHNYFGHKNSDLTNAFSNEG